MSRERLWSHWCDWWPLYLIALAVAICAVLLLAAQAVCSKERTELVKLCEQFKPTFECKAMFVHYCSGPGVMVVPQTYVVTPLRTRP